MRLSKEIYDFGLKDDRMNFFMQKVVQKYRSSSWVYGEENAYAYLSLQRTRDILGSVKYSERLSFLLKNGYVEQVIVGKNSVSGNNIKAYIPKTFSYKKRKRSHKFMDNYYNNIEKSLTPIAKQILRNLRKTKINISEKQFWSEVGVVDSDEKLSAYQGMLEEIQEFNSSSAKEINEYIVEDEFGKRIHTIISRLPKKIRQKYVYINGEQTVELDLAQSQPTILGKLLEKEIGSNSFSSCVRHNDIYLELVDKISGITRDDAKTIFYKIVFGKYDTKHTDMFFSVFSDTKEYITKIKRIKLDSNPSNKRHSNLAHLLQRKESDVFRQVWGKLKRNRIMFLTVHDSILIQTKNLNKSLNLITSELMKHIHTDINITIDTGT